jgi:hypothetical protein
MDKKEREKLRYEKLKLLGLCNCGRPNLEIHGPRCTYCRERFVAYRRKRISDNPLSCVYCQQSKAGNSKKACDSCLEKRKMQIFIKRESQYGKWRSKVGANSLAVAKGLDGGKPRISSCYFPWTHQDFCKAFPSYKESGKQIDHIIPLACAETEGELDMAFGELAVRLENIQLLTPSENTKKACNIERQIKARALALRQQGKHGAELFHQLWAEFAYPQRQEEGNQDALPNG